MKKLFISILVFTAGVMAFAATAYAQPGMMGFWGGVTEGVRLPKTTEVIIAEAANARKTTAMTLPYKELVFLSGASAEFTGTITIKITGEPTADFGTIKANYVVAATASNGTSDSLARNVTFNVNYRKEGAQIVYDYEAAAWTETVNINGTAYRLNRSLSHFGVSILEDNTPGVGYYKGDISQKSVYSDGTNMVTLESSGTIYGYNCAWSNTETHRIDASVITDTWQMQYQIRPSVSVSKTLQYGENEPTAISFSGNYKEIMSNKSGLEYNILSRPIQFSAMPLSGTASISTYNTFEQLTAPDLAALKGHPAESDISKLYSMGIIDGEPSYYKPDQAVTRGQFVTMLVKAIKLPIEPVPAANKKNNTITITFPDVMPDRTDYPYIMAAYKSGIASGRGSGYFHADYAMQREEAFTIMIRAIGLTNLGLDPTPRTMYADDAQISGWAKKNIYAGTRIGLYGPDAYGNINPKGNMTKAEAAALINSLVDYLRQEIQRDYTEHIVGYVK